MSHQQEPNLHALAAEASRARKDREQGLKAKYRVIPIEGLEQLVNDPSSPLSFAQRKEIRNYLLLGKRELKTELERMERIGHVYEKTGMPTAVTSFSAYTWLVHSIGLSGTLRATMDVLMFFLAVVIWMSINWAAWRRVERARKMLIELGKVD